MRSDLEKIKGIKDITTDFTTHIATFKVATPQPELAEVPKPKKNVPREKP